MNNLHNLTPKEIWKRIKEAPPFQQDDVQKSFFGIEVGWDLNYTSIHKINNAEVNLTFSPKDVSFFPLVNFDIAINEYPEIKTWNRDHSIYVCGTISNIDGFGITLKNVKIFPNQAAAQSHSTTPNISIEQIHFGKGDNLVNSQKTTHLEKFSLKNILITLLTSLLIAYIVFRMGWN